MNTASITTLASVLLTCSAFAQAEHKIEHTFDISGQQKLTIDVPVGSLELSTNKSNQVTVSIELKAKNNSFFSDDVALEEITLKHQQSSDKLSLSIAEDDVQQTWLVSMPEAMAIDLALGVGDIEVNKFANSAAIDVGVGAVRISSALADYQSITLDSGVGDTKISGMKNDAKHSRKIVSSTSKYRGDGQHTINIEVGVGDIKVRH
ncbi:MAG TPA: hypothetical protein ENH88_09830 [Pseudoalteromonas prydzensis]|uniref:Adhesin domain-containing protein n=2 Tax=root TaxID=1 RepID=A0A7V1CYM2_9GAMM|nr:hypothetical protein [Pseudoalteromonas prydzensis]HEA16726.1 hypothetical protein [Pseudoalteromonas prydzensis]